MDTSIRRGSWEMVAAMLISGTIGWFVLVSGVSVLEVVFWRCVIGALTLLLVCALLGYLRRDLLSWAGLGLAMLSGVAIVGNWLLLFESYSRASIAISTAVYNVQPFMLVMLAALFLGEKLSVPKLAWLSVAFLGMLAIVSAHGNQPTGDDYLAGIALALGAAFLYALAALIIKRLKAVPPHLIALIQVTTGALLLAPLVPWHSLPVDLRNGRISGWFDGAEVCTWQAERTLDGYLGLWTMADSVTLFRDLTIQPPDRPACLLG